MFYYNCGGCLLACGCLLILILVPMSFVKLQYYEHGLKMQRSTSTVRPRARAILLCARGTEARRLADRAATPTKKEGW